MLRGRIKLTIPACLLTLLLTGVLVSDFAGTTASPHWLQLVNVEILAACRDAGTQWMVVVCLTSYFVAFVVLRRRAERSWQIGDGSLESKPQAQDLRRHHLSLCESDFWLCALVALVLLRYAFSYGAASGNTQALMLIAGAAVMQGVVAWLAWEWNHKEHPVSENRPTFWNSRADKLRGIVMSCLVLLLAGAALLKNQTGMEFQYRGTTRWSGPWNNPNTYGVLMGVGLTLSVGLFIQFSKRRVQVSVSAVQGQESRVGKAWRAMMFILFVVAAGLCAFGLIKSYSRGAWLGTGLGLAWLVVAWAWRMGAGRSGPKTENSCLSWLRRNWAPLSVLTLSVLVLSFWNFRHTEGLVVRRAFSAGNINDFSWRNRVAAWEGSLTMMADRPVFGFGWNVPEKMYDHAYRSANLEEGMAIQLNDFFTLGMSLGVPALFCFFAYLFLSMRGPSGQHLTSVSAPVQHDKLACLGVGSGGPDIPKTLGVGTQIPLTAVCFAGNVVLLVGFWFDGGLFKIPLAAVFWVLLGLSRWESRDEGVKQGWVNQYPWLGVAVVMLALMTGMVWASTREPLRHEWFDVAAPQRARTECSVVMPKGHGPFPVVIWSYGSGGSLLRSYQATRQIAELGLAAVCFEYDQTNQLNFNEQMLTVLGYVNHQSWGLSNSVAWIGTSLGAQRQLSFLATHRDRAPRAMVRLNGGWVDEVETFKKLTSVNSGAGIGTQIPTRIWMIHGEQDEVFSASSVRQLEAVLNAAGVSVRLSMFPGRGHVFGSDQPLLATLAAEFCAAEFGTPPRVTSNMRPRLLLLWVPLLFVLGLLAFVRLGRHLVESWRDSGYRVRALSILSALAATGLSAIHFFLPLCHATPLTLRIARQVVLKQNLDAYFVWLTELSGCSQIRIKDLLTHVELAAMQRNSFGTELEDGMFREFVLSPQIDPSCDGEMNWRRPLWESFYPRIRKESSIEAAAEIVGRHLRTRITTGRGSRGVGNSKVEIGNSKMNGHHSIAETWEQGVADEKEFEAVYVAALRSVGIPSRIDAQGRAEFWNGEDWKLVLKPVN